MRYTSIALTALMSPSLVFANQLQDKVTNLEEQIQSLQEESSSDKVRFSGFFSIGANYANNDVGFAGAENKLTMKEMTKIGLQADFSLSDSTSVITQLLANNQDGSDFQAKFEWAYLQHSFDNGLAVIVGKFAAPIYMYSNFLEVGYAQPWARPPEAVYGIKNFSTIVGTQLAYDIELDESTIGLKLFGGTKNHNQIMGGRTLEEEFDNILGIHADWTYDALTIGAVYQAFKVTNSVYDSMDEISAKETPAYLAGFGMTYDDGDWLLASEYTKTHVDGGLSDTNAYYVMLGSHFGAWLPSFTYSHLETSDDSQRTGPTGGSFSVRNNAYSLGLRYDISSNVALKGDVTYSGDFEETSGVLGSPTLTDDNTMVYSITLDSVF